MSDAVHGARPGNRAWSPPFNCPTFVFVLYDSDLSEKWNVDPAM
ncbi:hypothetical protein [Streptomyces zhihengii]